MKILTCVLLLFCASPVYAQQQSLLTTQVPQVSTGTQAWELGVQVSVDAPGNIIAIGFNKIAGKDPGPHIGHVWSSTGALLSTVTFVGETASGMQFQTLPTPIHLNAGVWIVASVNSPAGANYALLPGGFTTALVNGHLSAPISAGRYGTSNTLPHSSTPTNYFRDVVFVPDAPLGTITITPDPLSAGGLLAVLTKFASGNYTATITISSSTGAVVISTSQIVVP